MLSPESEPSACEISVHLISLNVEKHGMYKAVRMDMGQFYF